MSRVVNLRDFQVIRADGRRGRIGALPDDVTRIDRLTRWGNPYKIGDGAPAVLGGYTRDDVLALYRDWLDRRLARDPNFLRPLVDMRLACWCAPEPCHGDVIVERLAAPTAPEAGRG